MRTNNEIKLLSSFIPNFSDSLAPFIKSKIPFYQATQLILKLAQLKLIMVPVLVLFMVILSSSKNTVTNSGLGKSQVTVPCLVK